jgi:hypothetical protein
MTQEQINSMIKDYIKNNLKITVSKKQEKNSGQEEFHIKINLNLSDETVSSTLMVFYGNDIDIKLDTGEGYYA